MATVRPAAVAGSFYPADADELRVLVERYLTAQPTTEIDITPAMIIVPHAGYVYSGSIAASAYRMLAAMQDPPRRVLLIGPSHFTQFTGIATPGVDGLATPLGVAPVDRGLIATAEAYESVAPLPSAHSREHSLEVQLPFLQIALGDFTVAPLLTGDVTPGTVADVLDGLIASSDIIGVISSDLSHYLDYDTARRKDTRTAGAITGLRPQDIAWDDACGRIGVQAALLVAQRRRWRCRLLDLANSGDTAGFPDRVVGYGAFALGPEA